MFDLGWTELLVIGIVALIVVGPKDLPGMFRTVGRFVGKAKGMAREFSKAMNDAADDAGVSGMSDTLRKASNPIGSAMNEVRKSTTSFTQATRDAGKPKADAEDKPKAEPEKLSAERQEAKDKITAHSAKKTQERLDREKADAEAASAPAKDTAENTHKPAPKAKTQRKTPATKTAAAKKPAAKTQGTDETGKAPAAKKAPARKATTAKAAPAKSGAPKAAAKTAPKPRKTAKAPESDENKS